MSEHAFAAATVAPPPTVPAAADPRSPSLHLTTPVSENFRQFPIPEKNSAPLPPSTPPPALTPPQQAALALLLAGHRIGDIARALNITPRTLYNWRHHDPRFIAELTRLQRDLWLDVAADLRTTVAAAVDTLRAHLGRPNDMTQLRAARLLINLVNSPRLAPTGPTTVEGILDQMLHDTTPPPATPDQQAQRQALLHRLLTECNAPTGVEPSSTV